MKSNKKLQTEWMSDEEWEDNETPVSYPSKEVEKYSKKGYGEYPEISRKENKRVDDWWEKYKKMKSPDDIKQHLDEFLENNPKDVILNLGLEYEVLFELIGDFLKLGKINEIIPYMMQFREKHPEVYVRSAGYYDSDIIAWLVSKNRTGEIVNYLNYFKQYPINNIETAIFEKLPLFG